MAELVTPRRASGCLNSRCPRSKPPRQGIPRPVASDRGTPLEDILRPDRRLQPLAPAPTPLNTRLRGNNSSNSPRHHATQPAAAHTSAAGDGALLCLDTFWRHERWHLLFPHTRPANLSKN